MNGCKASEQLMQCLHSLNSCVCDIRVHDARVWLYANISVVVVTVRTMPLPPYNHQTPPQSHRPRQLFSPLPRIFRVLNATHTETFWSECIKAQILSSVHFRLLSVRVWLSILLLFISSISVFIHFLPISSKIYKIPTHSTYSHKTAGEVERILFYC